MRFSVARSVRPEITDHKPISIDRNKRHLDRSDAQLHRASRSGETPVSRHVADQLLESPANDAETLHALYAVAQGGPA